MHIDRKSGEVTVEDEEGEYEIELGELGRIAAQAVKQGFVQRLREAERDVLYEEFENRVGTLVNGQVQRYEGQDLVVNMGRAEAYLWEISSASRVRRSISRPTRRSTSEGRLASSHSLIMGRMTSFTRSSMVLGPILGSTARR